MSRVRTPVTCFVTLVKFRHVKLRICFYLESPTDDLRSSMFKQSLVSRCTLTWRPHKNVLLYLAGVCVSSLCSLDDSLVQMRVLGPGIYIRLRSGDHGRLN